MVQKIRSLESSRDSCAAFPGCTIRPRAPPHRSEPIVQGWRRACRAVRPSRSLVGLDDRHLLAFGYEVSFSDEQLDQCAADRRSDGNFHLHELDQHDRLVQCDVFSLVAFDLGNDSAHFRFHASPSHYDACYGAVSGLTSTPAFSNAVRIDLANASALG